jgi:hypothetical protein
VQNRGKNRPATLWHEVFDPDGEPRELYRPVLGKVLSAPGAEKRLIVERLEAVYQNREAFREVATAHARLMEDLSWTRQIDRLMDHLDIADLKPAL